jgi:hypothetical protein
MWTPDDIQDLFNQSDGSFRLARWERPIVPVVFGVEDATLSTVKGAIEAIVAVAGHKMAETDPEQGANCMVFFLRDWAELLHVPDLNGLVPGISELVPRLQAAGANQYRHFRFEENGAIRAAFVFLRMDAAMSRVAAEDLALAQAAQLILLWGEDAFRERSPLARIGDMVVLRPEVSAIIRAAYDPVMPVATTEPAQALRIAARLTQTGS